MSFFAFANEDPAKSQPEGFDWETIYAFKKYGNPGILSAFSTSTSLPTTKNKTFSHMEDTNNLSGKFMIGNYSLHDTVEYQIFCIFDYLSIPCNTENNNRVSIKNDEYMIFDIFANTVMNSKHNFSDFILIAISESFGNIENSHLHYRANIYYGDIKKTPTHSNLLVENGLYYTGATFLDLTVNRAKSFHCNDKQREILFRFSNGNNYSLEYRKIIAQWDSNGGISLKILPDNHYIEAHFQGVYNIDKFIGENIDHIQVFLVFSPYIDLKANNLTEESDDRILSTKKYRIRNPPC